MPKLQGEVIAILVKTNAEKARTAAAIGQTLKNKGLLSHKDAAAVAAEELVHATAHSGEVKWELALRQQFFNTVHSLIIHRHIHHEPSNRFPSASYKQFN